MIKMAAVFVFHIICVSVCVCWLVVDTSCCSDFYERAGQTLSKRPLSKRPLSFVFIPVERSVGVLPPLLME